MTEKIEKFNIVITGAVLAAVCILADPEIPINRDSFLHISNTILVYVATVAFARVRCEISSTSSIIGAVISALFFRFHPSVMAASQTHSDVFAVFVQLVCGLAMTFSHLTSHIVIPLGMIGIVVSSMLKPSSAGLIIFAFWLSCRSNKTSIQRFFMFFSIVIGCVTSSAVLRSTKIQEIDFSINSVLSAFNNHFCMILSNSFNLSHSRPADFAENICGQDFKFYLLLVVVVGMVVAWKVKIHHVFDTIVMILCMGYQYIPHYLESVHKPDCAGACVSDIIRSTATQNAYFVVTAIAIIWGVPLAVVVDKIINRKKSNAKTN